MTKRVTIHEARALLDAGHKYLDVRSIPEFEGGRPAGATNVPIMHSQGGQMAPNPDFLAVMEACFPKDTPLVVGCRSGQRSLRAATALAQAGYAAVVDVLGGFGGDGTNPGWGTSGLPVEHGPSDYPALLARKK